MGRARGIGAGRGEAIPPHGVGLLPHLGLSIFAFGLVRPAKKKASAATCTLEPAITYTLRKKYGMTPT